MRFNRLTNIATRSSHYTMTDFGIPAGLVVFCLAGMTFLFTI
jgi:hypothetical protein